MTIDKEKLKALAEASTPGRHYDRLDSAGGGIKYTCTGDDGSLVLQVDHKNDEFGFIGPKGEADEAFFLACSPDTVLALLAEIERLATSRSKKERELEQELEVWHHGPFCWTCGDTGDVHDITGEWRGECDCLSAQLINVSRERDQLKAENEALRKQIADLSPFRHAPPQDYRASNKCLACGEYHHGLGNLPCPKCAPVAQAFASVNQRVVPVEPLRIPHPLETMAKEASHD